MADDYAALLDSIANGRLDDVIGYRPPVPVQAVPEKPSALRRVPDIGVTALKGAVGLPEALVGLADIPTGGIVGRGVERAGVRFGEAQNLLSEMYSPQQKAAQAAVSEGLRGGFLPGMSAAIRHPSTIATTIGESIPTMLGGAGIARGALKIAPKLAPWVAGAMGEGIIGAGSAAEQIRQQSKTGYLEPKQALSALGSGAGTFAFGALGGKLASKYGLGDVETALARGSLGKSDKGFLRRVVESGLSEGVLEELPQSVQEQMWQNYATDRPITEGVGEAAGMGMLAGVGMGATVGALTKRRDLTKPPPPREVEPLAEPGAAIQPRSALQEQIDLATGVDRSVYQSEMEAAMNQVVGSVGPRNVTAWEQHVAAFPDLFAKKVKAKPVVPEKVKPTKPTEDPLIAAAPTKAGKKAVADYNQRLSTGQITQQQHEDLVNAIHGDTEVAKVNQTLRKILKENKDALQVRSAKSEAPPVGEAGQVVSEGGAGMGQVVEGAEVAQAGEAKEEIAPVTVTTPEGVFVVQPKIRKGDRSRKSEVGAALRPVATDPVPTVPADYEDAPAYEAAVMKYVISGVPTNELLAVNRVRAAEQEDPDVLGESFEAAAKVLGVSKTAVRGRFNKGLSKMKANARAANLDWDTAAELLNITPPQAEAVSIGEAGQEGGMRAAVAPSEEFEPAYGMERGETTGEEGAVLEEGEAIEPGIEEAEIDATSALLESQIADASERALAAYPVEYVQMAEAIWGKGFNDMPGFAQARFVRDVANMARSSDGDVDAFEAGIDRLKGERDGKKYTYDLAETVSGRDEVAAGKPESTGRGGRGDVESGVVTGAKGAAGVKVEIKKRRTISRSEKAIMSRIPSSLKITVPQEVDGEMVDKTVGARQLMKSASARVAVYESLLRCLG